LVPGGIHRKYNIYPDIAVFAKSIANGYAMSAILGTEKVMQAAQKTFISSTNWTDRVGPSASLATIKKYIREKAEIHLVNIGSKVKAIWQETAKNEGLDISVSGLSTLGSFKFNSSNPIEMNTIFNIEMLKEGFLGFRQFKPSLTHGHNEISLYQSALKKIFRNIANGNSIKNLSTPNHHNSFERLTKE
jgi:glutamate-1-semialdehyde 2,1-aminomutase